ncbi:MAG: putative porin, partial [Bacteroidota bacterium]
NAYWGAGTSVSIDIKNSIRLFGAVSSVEKPYDIFEEQFVLPGIVLNKQKITSLELSAEYADKFVNARLGFFHQSSANSLISAALKEDSAKTGRAIYFDVKDVSLQGINLNLNFKIWKFLFSTNSSLYFNDQNRLDYKMPKFSSSGGVYYIDTLFNRNLKLRTGINYYSVGDQYYTSIDFEKSIVSNYIYDPSTHAASLISNSQITPSFQIDFFLAGHIQKSAIIYFVWENLLNANYFISPYYPKQSRGLRLGVAWEFLD